MREGRKQDLTNCEAVRKVNVRYKEKKEDIDQLW